MLQLFGHPFSSYTWKALIPLHAASQPFTFRMLGPEHPENHAVVQERTPGGKFPLLLDGEEAVFEATGIVEHLAATRPECGTLVPADPLAAAHMRMLDRVFDNYVMANLLRVVQAHLRLPLRPIRWRSRLHDWRLPVPTGGSRHGWTPKASPLRSRSSPAPRRHPCSTAIGCCR